MTTVGSVVLSLFFQALIFDEMTALDTIILVDCNRIIVLQILWSLRNKVFLHLMALAPHAPILPSSVSRWDMIVCCICIRLGIAVGHFDSYSFSEKQPHEDLECPGTQKLHFSCLTREYRDPVSNTVFIHKQVVIMFIWAINLEEHLTKEKVSLHVNTYKKSLIGLFVSTLS